MREVVTMPIAAIAMDRWPQEPKTLAYANLLLRGTVFPPIRVHLRDGRWRISDGRHRVLAHKLAGMDTILVSRAVRRRATQERGSEGHTGNPQL